MAHGGTPDPLRVTSSPTVTLGLGAPVCAAAASLVPLDPTGSAVGPGFVNRMLDDLTESRIPPRPAGIVNRSIVNRNSFPLNSVEVTCEATDKGFETLGEGVVHGKKGRKKKHTTFRTPISGEYAREDYTVRQKFLMGIEKNFSWLQRWIVLPHLKMLGAKEKLF